MTKELNITIDGMEIKVPEGTTIMQAADQLNIHIPRLCYHPHLSKVGACRVCLVEIEGMKKPVTSCNYAVADGMKIKTQTAKLRQLRRTIVELILNNHPDECQVCARNTNCELQTLAYECSIRERKFQYSDRKHANSDASSPAIIRNPEKCISCGRCIRICSEVEGVCNLSFLHRGTDMIVSPAHEAPMKESVCVHCGQCAAVCPTAAIVENDSTQLVIDALMDPKKHVVIQTAPAIRATIGEGFGFPIGTYVTGKMVTALKKCGFDKVFDTNFSADLTIMEEATEFLTRFTKGENLPLITSCSPGWINFLEKFFPEMIPNVSTCKSPMSMLSPVLKTYYAEKAGIDPKDMFVVAIMPCTAKKYEAQRPEHRAEEGYPYTDAVLTTREAIQMIKSFGIDMKDLEDSEFDSPLGESSGAADIFGVSGGVMEAALRTAYEKVTGEECPNLNFEQVRGLQGTKECTIDIKGTLVKVAITNGLINAKTLLKKLQNKEVDYHFIEIMACPGGCSGGGGQPYPPKNMAIMDEELLKKRAKALYTIDSEKKLRKSHENPSIIKIYEEFFGEPNSEKAHHLLHTHYSAQYPHGV